MAAAAAAAAVGDVAKPRVYRLRRLPRDADRLRVIQILCRSMDGVAAEDVCIGSLADTVNPWEEPTKTATLTFKRPPSALEGKGKNFELAVEVVGLKRPLLLDAHFRGFTPLNDVVPGMHEYDCIAISGLASHPFGSWQPRGGDKSFMWIRDAMPACRPGTRFITYGYDTELVGSRSFQSITDLASTLVTELTANGWARPTTKPFMFLAHSLGGVILKQALVMLAGSGARETFMLTKVNGAICFGVPSNGMATSHLLAMVKDQPNRSLVKDLSEKSEYLCDLGKQFDGIAHNRHMKLFWAYETLESPTAVELPDGSFATVGAEVVLVKKESATNNNRDPTEEVDSIIQINENHSNMVKFGEGDTRLDTIASKLLDIEEEGGHQRATAPGAATGTPKTRPEPRPESESMPNLDPPLRSGDNALFRGNPTLPISNSSIGARDWASWDSNMWDLGKVLRNSLCAPERDRRLTQIDEASKHTFDWVLENSSLGFTDWLRTGDNIFWISGKPGSGKSTLMKFIYNDDRTAQLLQKFGSTTTHLSAGFFFHHRGDVVQKSFEGLLRGILSQIFESRRKLKEAILPGVLERQFQERVDEKGLGDLGSDITFLFAECGEVNITGQLEDAITIIIRSQQTTDGAQLKALADGANARHGFKSTESSIFSELVRKWREGSSLAGLLRWLLRWRQVKITSELYVHFHYVHQRHVARVRVREALETAPWTTSELKGVLLEVLQQTIAELDITLFLDAVDEYDGPPEFISTFLKDLVQQSFPMTRIRICCSSRPWKTFAEQFSSYPGFKIHEHTEEDMQQYCTATIDYKLRSASLLNALIPDIVRRAKGVFLWVKLVIGDLTRVAVTHDGDTAELAGKLRSTLDSLPEQLDEYYHTIVERIPENRRWDTYVVLECICRSHVSLSPWSLLAVLSCSTSNNPAQYVHKIDRREGMQRREMEAALRISSGGLVEAVQTRDGKRMQLMHQTVKEFVESPGFKHAVLGERGKFTPENGHTFLAWWYLVRNDVDLTDFRLHARLSELETGRSLFGRLSNTNFIHNHPSPNYVPNQSPIQTAVLCGLNLFLKDAFAANKDVFRESEDNLYLSLLYVVRFFEFGAETTETALFITSHGYCVDGVALGSIGTVLQRGILRNVGGENQQLLSQQEMLLSLIIIAFENGTEVDVPVTAEGHTGTMLHFCLPELQKYLLQRGAYVNALSTRGETPLDSVVKHTMSFHHSGSSWSGVLESTLLLGQHRGKFCKISPRECEEFLMDLKTETSHTVKDQIGSDFPQFFRSTKRGVSTRLMGLFSTKTKKKLAI